MSLAWVICTEQLTVEGALEEVSLLHHYLLVESEIKKKEGDMCMVPP